MIIFRCKNCDIFLIFAPKIDRGYKLRMFKSKNKRNNVYPCKPQFYYIKVGCLGVNYTGELS